MKIKRFVAPDMRAAMKAVREEQGPNAVILSSRRVDSGVEVVAATDYDEALVQQALRREESQEAAQRAATPAPEQKPQIEEPRRQPRREGARVEARREPARAVVTSTVIEDPSIRALRAELTEVRSMLSREIGRMGDMRLRNAPGRAHALDELEAMGVSGEFARQLVACIAEDADNRKAQSLMLGLLAKSLVMAPHDAVMEGGVIALVGPTGVGKTTTIAKLAARFAARHGSRNVAMVTTDGYRVGAREQLFTYGRLLGMPVIEANSGEELRARLEALRDYRLVLVDTAGMSPRDLRLAAQLSWLSDLRQVRTWLALPANGQAADLDATINAFRVAQPVATVITKLDETTRLGTALSATVRHKLPIAYVADGQRVPEDLHPHPAHQLVLKARELAVAAHRTPDREVHHVAA